MLQLTPLEKSVAVQQLIRINVTKSKKEAKEEGINEGLKKGMKQGELIGEIRTIQRILKYPQSIQSELAEKPLKELRAMLQKLKSDLG
jgi:flagellar biosynthesis/type III secretory pathway protein FliH